MNIERKIIIKKKTLVSVVLQIFLYTKFLAPLYISVYFKSLVGEKKIRDNEFFLKENRHAHCIKRTSSSRKL